ncbi:MAG: hypothetical protein FWF63_03285 [Fibromonadales bacterium]|nr:hypothetical protein [Fibromonadales bacterium]
MKKILLAISLIFLLLGCFAGNKSTHGGMENEAFLDIVGTQRNYAGGVTVILDDKTSFNAAVNDPASNTPRGKTYAIEAGQRTIAIQYNGKDLYRKQIFVSAQETRRIALP